MTELPFVTILVITVAATIYCAKQVLEMADNYKKSRAFKKLEELVKLQETALEEIETDLDLWWSDGPSEKVQDFAKQHLPFPEEMRELLPEEMIQGVTGPVLKQCYEAALNLAVHARLRNKEEQLIGQLPARVRQDFLESYETHKRKLDNARTQLVEAGISIEELEELEARLAPSN